MSVRVLSLLGSLSLGQKTAKPWSRSFAASRRLWASSAAVNIGPAR
jgi:hypothetical protein